MQKRLCFQKRQLDKILSKKATVAFIYKQIVNNEVKGYFLQQANLPESPDNFEKWLAKKWAVGGEHSNFSTSRTRCSIRKTCFFV